MQTKNSRQYNKSFSSHIHVPRLKREAATIVMLRKKNYSINTLSRLLGRSTSFVHKILKFNGLTGYSWVGAGFYLAKSLHKLDKRKSTGIRRDATRPWAWLWREENQGVWAKWEAFLLGEEDEPP